MRHAMTCDFKVPDRLIRVMISWIRKYQRDDGAKDQNDPAWFFAFKKVIKETSQLHIDRFGIRSCPRASTKSVFLLQIGGGCRTESFYRFALYFWSTFCCLCFYNFHMQGLFGSKLLKIHRCADHPPLTNICSHADGWFSHDVIIFSSSYVTLRLPHTYLRPANYCKSWLKAWFVN